MMQGRLSPIVGGKIQSFPWKNWRYEISILNDHGISGLEWTIDLKKYFRNPIISDPIAVNENIKKHNVGLWGVTSDAHMQGEFWGTLYDQNKVKLLNKISKRLFDGIVATGAAYVVIPLVDGSSIKSDESFDFVLNHFLKFIPLLERHNFQILFEVDLEPNLVKKFIERFPKNYFGINYDTGNSASLGFNVEEEIRTYGRYIYNVHIKDRKYGGPNCPLGTGDVDFKKTINLLSEFNYSGKMVLQTARSNNGEHSKILTEQLSYLQQFRD